MKILLSLILVLTACGFAMAQQEPEPTTDPIEQLRLSPDQRQAIRRIVADLDIRVIHATTGELLRRLTLDPTRNYQPTGRPPGPPRRKPQQPEPQ